MIKLYKKQNDKLEYCEYWLNNEEGLIYLHRGIVGERGSYVTEPCKNEEKYKKEFIRKYEKQGYEEIPDENMFCIVAQYYFRSELDRSSVETLYNYISGILNEELGWTGLGEVDGYDFGKSTNPQEDGYCLNIYSIVVDDKLAKKLLYKVLPKEYGKYRIGIRTGSGNDDYVEDNDSVKENKSKSKFYL